MFESVLALFSVTSLGLALGKIRIKGFSLDNAAVIFVGLIFGHFGVVIPEIFQTIGLIFFVFSVGMQSGPGFLFSFSSNGLKMVLPTLFMILASVGIMLGLSALLGLDPELALGLLTGGRSSNSALAVGVQSVGSELPALGHSLAYPISVLAIVFFIRFLPLFLRANIAQEEKEYMKELSLKHPTLETRTYKVSNPNVFGKTLESLHLGRITGVNISRLWHEGETLVPKPGMILFEGDLVKAVGLEKDLASMSLLVGPEVHVDHFQEIPQDSKHDAQWLMVTNKTIVNRTLNSLSLVETYGATVTRLQRNGVEISPHGTSFLRYGDKIMVVARKTQSETLRALIGDARRTVDKDFFPLFLIIALGLLLGSITLDISPGFSFKLGMTGGVLIASLVLSALGKTGPMLWVVSEPSTRFIRQLGLLLFLGAVGTNAGSRILPVLLENGPSIILTTLAISLIPLILMAWFCRVFLKMNILTLMGLLSGATTCSPALGVAGSLSGSTVPNIAYATVFPFAMIFMMLCTQILAVF